MVKDRGDADAHRPVRVLLSYAVDDADHENGDEHRTWVKRLATRLRGDGVDARLDQWHLGGGSVVEFMNRELRNADKVRCFEVRMLRSGHLAMLKGGQLHGLMNPMDEDVSLFMFGGYD